MPHLLFFLLLALPVAAQRPVRDLHVEPAGPGGPPAGAPRRLALVIGNKAYPGSPLKNPANDAQDISAALKELHFHVETMIDGSLGAMEAGVDRFAKSLRQGDQAFFFFAGHGLQLDSVNYLAPVDFQASSEAQAKRAGLSFADVQAKLERTPAAATLMVVDACRNNPWRAGAAPGLATVYAGLGSYIVFATAPGRTASDNPAGRNGLFTQYLFEEIRKPLFVGDLFRQVRAAVFAASGRQQMPYLHDQLIQPLVLTGAAPQVPQPALPGPAARAGASVAARGKAGELVEQGLAAYRGGRCEAAFKQFDLATRQDPESPFAQHAAGVALVCQGLRAQAIERFRLAVELDPEFAPAYQSRGRLYLDEGSYSLAIQDFTWWIEQEPQNAAAHALRGRAQFLSRNYEEAASDLSRAVELNPTDAETRFYRGELFHRQGDYRAANTELSEAIRLRSDYAAAYETRSRSRERLGDKTGAESDRKAALQFKPR